MDIVFEGIESYRSLDYISCWFIKGVRYASGRNIQFAFVTTNSICQGEQVGTFWPNVLNVMEIGFAHQSFKWGNNAKGVAGVTCMIIGMRNKSNKVKELYKDGICREVDNITPYITAGQTVYVNKRSAPISQIQPILRGNGLVDDGNLTLNRQEYDELLHQYPEAKKFIRKFIGADELINDIPRWCIWIEDNELNEALRILPIQKRIDKVYKFRSESKKGATRDAALRAHRFAEVRYPKEESIIIPSTSSERRRYIPIDFLPSDTIISHSAQAIYTPEPYTFAILCSNMHMVWVKTVCGRLKSDFRYSSALGYNTFPFPSITGQQKKTLELHVGEIMDIRESHSEKTLAWLYDPDTMPTSLREAHSELDVAIERCYRGKPFKSDEERLEYLFTLYTQMIKDEQQ